MVAIFRARRVITMNGADAEAFAVLGGRVVALGPLDELRRRFPEAAVTDFASNVVAPGFHDAHMHLAMAAEDLLHLDASAGAVHSLAELKAGLLAEAGRRPPGTWIRASRYDDAKMTEGRVLNRWDLDEAAPEHPVLVVHVAGHWGVINSRALALGGIDEATPAPAGGIYGRDAAGRLNGIIYEQALFDFAYPAACKRERTVVPPGTPEERAAGLARACRMFNAAGLTSIGDALVGPQEIALFQQAEGRGLLTLRVNMMVTHHHFDLARRLGLASGFGGERLRIAGFKAFVDGAIGGRTCLLEEPFEGSSEDYGVQTTPTGELREIVRMVHEGGSRLCVHANGDRAISLLLDQFEAVQAAAPRPDARHRIEHCTVVNGEIVARMKRLGIGAAPFGSYVHYHGSKLLEWYGRRRLERMFAHRWFYDSGIAVAGSSDYPCGPYEPLLAMQSCTTRRGFDGPVMGENQRISPLEALALYTTGAAYLAGEEEIKGRLAPGYLADFVVLGEDPLTVEPGRLGAVAVRATYLGGKKVWPET